MFFGKLFILVVWEFDTVTGVPLVGLAELAGLFLIILCLSVIGVPLINYLLFRALDESDFMQRVFSYIESFILSVTLVTPMILQMEEIMSDDFRRCISRVLALFIFFLVVAVVIVNYLIHVIPKMGKYIFAEYRLGFYERKENSCIQIAESLRLELLKMNNRSSAETTPAH